jgi:hypothetical protein
VAAATEDDLLPRGLPAPLAASSEADRLRWLAACELLLLLLLLLVLLVRALIFAA